jgi:outer membrane lipoprotein-sorting protein
MRTSLLLIFSCACLFSAEAQAASAQEVLSRMDSAAPSFQAFQAQISSQAYTKVIDDKTTESGVFTLKKVKPKEMQVLIDFQKPDPRTIGFRGRKAEILYPKIKTVQEYDLGRTGLIEQFLLLGFGTSGRDLASNYDVKLVGEETVAGAKAWHLELNPKKPEMKKNLSKLELWMNETGSYPVMQKVSQPSGDYRVFTYSAVKLNPTLNSADLNLKLPAGVKREYPQRDR